MTTHRFHGHLDLDVRLLAGSVTLRAGGDGQATVDVDAETGAGQALIDDSRIEFLPRPDGARLVVHIPRDRSRRSWLSLRDPSVHVTLTVPEGSDLRLRTAAAQVRTTLRLGRVQVDAASGDVRLGDLDELEVSTASGDLEVGHVAGPASVRTASGGVRLGDVGGSLDVRSASGTVRAGSVDGDLHVRSVSGDVAIEGLSGAEVTVNATSGDVTLAIAPGLGVHLDVSTVSGSLSSELDEDDGTSGVDVRLRARTVSGDVHLRRTRHATTPPG